MRVDLDTAATGTTAKGPLVGIRVIELAGQGPVPFASMMLSDLGCEVIRVDPQRAAGDQARGSEGNFINRGRKSVVLDLKSEQGRKALRGLLETADVLLEGFRPGVCEKLGIDPEGIARDFPRLIFGRMSGWGQTGPFTQRACHDINILAVSGLLSTIGLPDQAPTPPPMYLGDFAGGGMVLAFGVAAALVERASSGHGQLIDASMLEGASLLSVAIRGMQKRGAWADERGSNAYDTGSHFYNVYETSDGRFMAVGSIESKFYRVLLGALGMDDVDPERQMDRSRWPELRARIADIFRTRTRDEWTELFDPLDCCVTPVLTLTEAERVPVMVERSAFDYEAGIAQPAAVPRFSRTPGRIQGAPPEIGQDNRLICSD